MKKKIKTIVSKSPWLYQIAFYLNNLYLKNKLHIIIGRNVKIGFSSICEGSNSFDNNVLFIGSKIGFGSYIGPDSKIINTKVGRFSSIGPNVNCIFGKHPSHTFVSTHPAFFSLRKQAGFTYTNKQLFNEFEKPESPESNHAISIGNDVWIGANVSLMDGIIIGNGAIVAANSLVNKDVPPYSIVGGVPAKIIKMRFEEDKIEFLLRFKWWDREESWIKNNADKFINIDDFYKTFVDEQ